jgi:putrescine:ornithine antiporter
MNVVQLTFIVAVNMMGSGIIMLPTNMAQVGAISLLSWIVTALGSMAIAWGFAQAGLFNQREGGMSAYAEDAYGKPGYFIVFFLYFLSLAIGNVAIAISAVGYLASFFPWLSSTAVATTIGVIGLLWLTTVANFGGPSLTGKIGSITVWGVILPVGFISFLGWIWFKGDTFSAAWNPHGLSLGEGMGSSIALTLWAFLGMESAAQNSAAVENPKRDVPLACMFGTLGAAVIYVLSTAVIQGIVPNAELAKSTGPFGLAYTHMFNPTVGAIVMGLAVLACLGSLLGWQFTISMTAKSAADQGMFPSFFSKLNGLGAPVVGMVVMGVVQSLLALSTASPTLSETFGVLVGLAVVTNVIPYIIALSALPLMMRTAGVEPGRYRLNVFVAVVAMLYSTYAIFASGTDAVMGGTLVMAIGFIIWGFIAHRFVRPGARRQPPEGPDVKETHHAIRNRHQRARAACGGPGGVRAGQEGGGGTGRETGGHHPGAGQGERESQAGISRRRTPLLVQGRLGEPRGIFGGPLPAVGEAVKGKAGVADLKVEWVPVSVDNQLQTVQQHQVDILCAAATVTLSRREQVDFSLPIFPGGVGVVVRTDAPKRLRNILTGDSTQYTPTWRAVALNILREQVFTAVPGTTAEQWIKDRGQEFQVQFALTPATSYEAGIQAVVDRKASAFFAERAILLDAVKSNKSARTSWSSTASTPTSGWRCRFSSATTSSASWWTAR